MPADREDRSATTDAELIAAAGAGDAVSFEVLYLRYRDWTVRLARRWSGSEADALDVLQDTFLYVLDKLPELELHARFTTFLFPVVRNLALARRRRAAREEADPPEPVVEDDPPARMEELAHALGALPERQRVSCCCASLMGVGGDRRAAEDAGGDGEVTAAPGDHDAAERCANAAVLLGRAVMGGGGVGSFDRSVVQASWRR